MADLKRFPRPSVAVDVAVLTVFDADLRVVLWRRTGHTHPGEWALPGSFLRSRERLARAVQRTLADKCGIRGLSPIQLMVMDDPDRDDRGWVLSVAYLEVVDAAALATRTSSGDVHLARVRRGDVGGRGRSTLELPDGQRALPFDHEQIVRHAISTLRARYRQLPDPSGLLGPEFTMRQLRELHETVAGVALQKDTFRRAMLPDLDQLGTMAPREVGRPARLFRRRSRSLGTSGTRES